MIVYFTLSYFHQNVVSNSKHVFGRVRYVNGLRVRESLDQSESSISIGDPWQNWGEKQLAASYIEERVRASNLLAAVSA